MSSTANNFLKKETLTQLFSFWGFWIFQNNCLIKQLWTTTSVNDIFYKNIQVANLRRNEYNSQFVFFVEMNILVIKERPFKISQNGHYDQS